MQPGVGEVLISLALPSYFNDRPVYAIAGYSYGLMIAFETTKLLNSHDDGVKFLGAFNLPPHIKLRMRQLNWANCVLHLSYFLDFFTEE
jgi:thioesterase domain-containing protein